MHRTTSAARIFLRHVSGDLASDPITILRRDLAAANGGTTIAPTMAGGHGAGPGAAPQHDYKAERFGFAPPTTVIEARRDVERSILAACGVPTVLANHAAAVRRCVRRGVR